MSISRSDLVRAKCLLLLYSGYKGVLDSGWVNCEGTLYKQYIFDELVKEGYIEVENGVYSMPEHLFHLKDEWLKIPKYE